MGKSRKEADKKGLTQASVIPFRSGRDGLQFCLITARKSGRWGFPKGSIPRALTPVQAALMEAHEEAGLVGSVVGEPLGGYRYRKRGRKEKESVVVMLMEVSSISLHWKESEQRQRLWTNAEGVQRRLEKGSLKQLFGRALDRLAGAPSVDEGSFLESPDEPNDGDEGPAGGDASH
ncbi:MAG TPA: NUDIX hydrolase [Pirellulaceae bacterium]|nr:NUDIX hydrolase [Pirellulaceae bacterium]